jgi:hypothetical protein
LLKDKNIPFAIRWKEDQLTIVEGREYALRCRPILGHPLAPDHTPAVAADPWLQCAMRSAQVTGTASGRPDRLPETQ